MLTTQSALSWSHTHKRAHIHTPIESSSGNLGLRALPWATATSDRRKLEMNLRLSDYKTTTLPTEPLFALLTEYHTCKTTLVYSMWGFLYDYISRWQEKLKSWADTLTSAAR